MKNKKLFKVISIILVAIMLLHIVPQSVIALAAEKAVIEETDVILQETAEREPEIVGEVISLRDEYTKHFRREDGSFVAALYNEPVHYLNSGEWEEISNTLTSNSESTLSETKKGAKYFVDKISTPITFPENINDGEITITNQNKVISFGAKSTKTKIDNSVVLSNAEDLVSASIAKAENTMTSPVKEEALVVASDNNAITYPNVFDNAYLEYEMSSSMLKESIVVTKRASEYVYEFSLDLGDYIPAQDSSGGIYIYEDKSAEEPIMAIAPPYMFDSDNEMSDAVTMELVKNENDYTLIVEADASWMNSLGRNFPVVIDPTFILDAGRSSIHDVHVNQDNPNTSYKLDYQLEVGKNGDNVFRTYIQYDLPTLPDCSVVTNAELQLVQNWARVFSNTDVVLNVYNCDTEWDFDTIKWNNQPITDLSTATVVDYTNFVEGMSAVYNLDITKIVKNWYENGSNYGLMLASSDETVNEKTSFYSSRNIVSNYPVVTIQYVNNTGVEDYWTYEGVSLGDSGSVAVNTYNGAFTYIHSDAETPSLVSPVNVSHVYTSDSDYGTFGNMNFGKGFKLNVIELIEEVDSEALSEEYPYKYIDADGTVHFFRYNSSTGNYYYEFDTNIILTKTTSGYTMSFVDGSQKQFNTNGYLTKTIDNNGVEVVITYDSFGKISKVTDGTGLKVSLSYDSNNRLTGVSNDAGVGTTFSYTADGYLSQIRYGDNKKTEFTYDNESGLIGRIKTVDNRIIDFKYKRIKSFSSEFYRVESYTIYGTDGVSLYDKIEFEYRTSDTLIKNSKEDKVVLAFDNTGKAINCIRNGETVSVSKYTGLSSSSSNNNNFNNLSYSSNNFTPKENMAKRLYTYGYSGSGNHSTSTDVFYNDTSSTKLSVDGETAGTSYRHRYVEVEGGKTYSFSNFVKIVGTLASGDVRLQLKIEDANGTLLETVNSKGFTTTDNKWKELNTTVTMPEGAVLCTVRCGLFNGIGTVYAEEFNAEEADAASNNYNLLKNSSFEGDSVGSMWTYSNGITANPMDSNETAAKFTGKPTATRYMKQTVSINGKAGDVLVYGASAQALCSASGNNNGDDGRFFGVRISLYQDDVLKQTGYVKFNEDAWDTMQTAMSYIKAVYAYDEVEFELCYNYEINFAIFDDAFLYRDAFGTYYTYDTNGRVVIAKDDNNNKINCTYSSNGDLINVASYKENSTVESATYTYDSNHNLLSSVGVDGVKTSYTYPTTGNKGLPLSVTVSDSAGEMSSTTTYEYYAGYRYLKSVTEPTGARTEYEYDLGYLDYGKGQLTKVTDPNGNVTEYSYQTYGDNVNSITNSPDMDWAPYTAFNYNDSGQVVEIYNMDVVYYMDYDAFGRLKKAETYECSNFLVNEYDSNGNLISQSYGDVGDANFAYDEDGRLISETYDDVLSYEYDYNNSGALGKLTDHENNVEWEYNYDQSGNLTGANSSNNTEILYDYDSQNRVEKFKVKKDGENLAEYQYTYRSDGKINYLDFFSISDYTYQTYAYDSLGRLDGIYNVYSNEDETEYAYVDQYYSYIKNGNNETGLVGSMHYEKWDEEAEDYLKFIEYSYSYDANGNITHVYEDDVLTNRYYYDALNRLVREDNAHLDKTVVFNYDECGDILSKDEYALTFGDLGTVVDSIEYEYDASCSLNAVSEYDGEEIEYDDYGNPTTYRGYAMTWAKARQLSTMSDADTSLSFKYDSNGIRTQKTVNNVTTEFTYIGSQLMRQKTGNEVLDFTYSALGTLFALEYNGTYYFYMFNLQGDVIGLYDVNGNVVVRYTYDAWGNPISITGSLADTVGVKNPFRYRGYYYDTETGLYYLQSRYYDPETGRFLNMDAYFIAGDYINGTNMYVYCLNNPVMYVDPSGCAAITPEGRILAKIFVMVAYCGFFANYLGEGNEGVFKEYLYKNNAHKMNFNEFYGFIVDTGEKLVLSVIAEYADNLSKISDYIDIAEAAVFVTDKIGKVSAVDGALGIVAAVTNPFTGLTEKISATMVSLLQISSTSASVAVASNLGGAIGGLPGKIVGFAVGVGVDYLFGEVIFGKYA